MNESLCFSGTKLSGSLDGLGLTCAGLFFAWEQFEEPGGVDSIARTLQQAGSRYAMIPWIPEKRRTDESDWAAVARQMSRWGKQLRESGYELYYHFHGYEFPVIEGGAQSGEDILSKQSDPDSLFFQLDTYWAVHGGADPLAFLRRHGKRVRSIHCKDMNNPKEMHDVEVGSGCIDFAHILPLALELGIRWFIVEQEQYDKAPREAAAICCRQLRGLLSRKV